MDPKEERERDTQGNLASASPSRILIIDRERFSTLIDKMLPESKFITDTAANGLQAIRKLSADPPDLALIEQSVPGDGLRIAELIGMNPRFNNVRMILMAVNPSPDGIIRARNAGVDTYLAKPFRPSELLNRIDKLLAPSPPPETKETTPPVQHTPEQRETDPGAGSDIQERIRHIEGLPPFPATHAELLKLSKSEDATSDDIAKKIKLDPSLLATVFKLVNSAGYGFQKKVDSLKLAVTLIGLEEIANLVMTAQVFQKLGDYAGGAGLDLEAFWKHSVGTAFVARAAAKKLQAEVESAFLAGMLHDLGKVVLDRCFADYYQAVIEEVRTSGGSLYSTEKSILGLTHTVVGGQLAVDWKFSENYLNAIRYHHEPGENRRFARLTCLVHLADFICRKLEYGSGGDETIPELDQSVIDRFSLGERGLAILTEAAREELQNADSFLSALTN